MHAIQCIICGSKHTISCCRPACSSPPICSCPRRRCLPPAVHCTEVPRAHANIFDGHNFSIQGPVLREDADPLGPSSTAPPLAAKEAKGRARAPRRREDQPRQRRQDRCGQCKSCKNPHWKKACSSKPSAIAGSTAAAAAVIAGSNKS